MRDKTYARCGGIAGPFGVDACAVLPLCIVSFDK